MPIIFDASGSGGPATNTKTITWSHTRGSGENHWLFVTVGVNGVNTTVNYNDPSITKTATYGGTPMTYLGGRNISGTSGSIQWMFTFGLQNPAAGTNTVSVTIDLSGYTPASMIGGSVSYSGVESINGALVAGSDSFGGVNLTGVQAPSGTTGFVAIASSSSAIIFTAPAGVTNRANGGSNTIYDGADFLSVADVPGDDAGYTLQGNNGGRWGMVFVTMNPSSTPGYVEDELTSYTSGGPYSYNIPPWATHIDIVLCGGGGGGEGSWTNFFSGGNGSGGDPGQWTTVTWKRGIDIPWDTTSITGFVGGGGAAGPTNGGGGTGGTTTATATGATTVTATGGVGRTSGSESGLGPGNQTYNNQLYIGGADRPLTGGGSSGNPGNPPGGGGSGASWATGWQGPGGAGAPGVAHFYAYSTGSSGLFFKMFN